MYFILQVSFRAVQENCRANTGNTVHKAGTDRRFGWKQACCQRFHHLQVGALEAVEQRSTDTKIEKIEVLVLLLETQAVLKQPSASNLPDADWTN
jgi:hypothetical protein